MRLPTFEEGQNDPKQLNEYEWINEQPSTLRTANEHAEMQAKLAALSYNSFARCVAAQRIDWVIERKLALCPQRLRG